MPRWHGPGRHTTKGYVWRHVECEFCGLRYRDFRITDEFPWMDKKFLWEDCKRELSLEREPQNSDSPPDPSRPVNRRAVLGRMFQYKQEAWGRHKRVCEKCYYENKAFFEEEGDGDDTT